MPDRGGGLAACRVKPGKRGRSAFQTVPDAFVNRASPVLREALRFLKRSHACTFLPHP